MAELDELTERLDTLEAIESIKQLKARYLRFVDEKKYDDFAALFTPDAALVVDGVTWARPADMVTAMRDYIGAAPTVHHGHMPEIDIRDDGTATGIWAMEDILPFEAGDNAPQGHHGYGQYRETYRKVGDRWLIDSLNLTRFRYEPLENWSPGD